MFKLVTDAKEIGKYYRGFAKMLNSKKLFPRQLKPFHVGHQGGSVADAARYSELYDIWVVIGDLSWNAFGLGNDPSMVVQVNFQELPQRKVGSVFALDENNEPAILHRGHIGGGRLGVGLKLMKQEYVPAPEYLQESDGTITECFLVCQLESPQFIQQLATFVSEVKRIKTLAKQDTDGLSGIAASLLNPVMREFISEKTEVRSCVESVDSQKKKCTINNVIRPS